MVHALKQKVTIGARGRVEIDSSDLPEGRTAEVIVVLDEPQASSEPPSLSSLFGKAKGTFASAQEADAFIREQRDEWEDRS